jgi:hypothetical protein
LGEFGELLLDGSQAAPDMSFSTNEIVRNTGCNNHHVIIHFTKGVPYNVVSSAQHECISSPRDTLNSPYIIIWDWGWNIHTTTVPVMNPHPQSHQMYSVQKFMLVASSVFQSVHITIDKSKWGFNTTGPFGSFTGIKSNFVACQGGLEIWSVVIVPLIVWISIG